MSLYIKVLNVIKDIVINVDICVKIYDIYVLFKFIFKFVNQIIYYFIYKIEFFGLEMFIEGDFYWFFLSN